MRAPVVVTGAGGNVGGAVARALQSAGVPLRVAGTAPDRLRRLFPGHELVRLDFLDAATFDAVLEGAAGLFLIRPPAIAPFGPTLNAFLDAAVRHRVGHVVFASVTGADTNRIVPHHRVERHLLASGLPWTILRPGFFAQNLADAYREDIVADGRIYLPAGHGRVAFIDTRDIGDVAAKVLADASAHAGRSYTLTGPQALTFTDVAAMLSEVLGRSVRYEPATLPGYLRHLHGRDMPLAQVIVQTALHAGLRRGQGETVDPTAARLLGRSPRTLAEYVREHGDIWSAEHPAGGAAPLG